MVIIGVRGGVVWGGAMVGAAPSSQKDISVKIRAIYAYIVSGTANS